MLENEVKLETLPAELPEEKKDTNNDDKNKVKLSKKMVELISQIATEAAVKAYCAENTIYDIAQMASENGDPDLLSALGLLGESRKVESIRDRVVFTRVAMENIAIAFDTYKLWCERSEKPEVQRRWRVLCKMYLDREKEMTPQEVADSEHISLSQVYVDIDNAAKDMEKRFFGLDPEIFD